ncbi:Fe2+-enterobactin ABC transporter substrate-binding protein [Microbacterium horticulturae]|uniref:Fe2+-enterobactin ABC transporter substrate-binding protein n=1 Tax=Microbacterium horticulturae TaxID=3028316 RepID=A0ABY8BYQ4_9MICO|nr:Fe2+-enterobactin ABC transporter substrate-binding protein [Microbacterium sp. KACC 23027]WEG08242.1 Fe2+-enterobactin ABC transporter substrate-binding protein [Microbacterium sp. KACC 23027]
MHARLKTALAAGAAIVALALSGCAASSEAATDDASAGGDWPRTIEHVNGSTEIPAQPANIVSTSITLTGTLLAIDAPVTATATTTPSAITDDEGFFSQWADVAHDRGVTSLYPNLEFDEEAVIAAAPDLIVVSSTGADATADQYDKLSAIAPTIVLNYGDESWQELAETLGEATGHEAEAKKVVADFDQRVADVAAKITVPDGTANAIVWNGVEGQTAFAKPGGSHAELLDALGFDVEGAPDEYDLSETAREDFAFLSIENTTAALTGSTVFLVSGGDATADDFADTKVLANTPAVKAGNVHALGDTSFRIDYYSASQIVDIVESDFA